MADLPKILLVDDVDFFLDMERKFLERTPATLLTARNGVEALEVARREKPDLVFMDVNMPIMDGLAAGRALKDDPLLRRVPVVLVFAASKECTEASIRSSGCDASLTKPVDREKFLDLGRKFLFQIERRDRRVPYQTTVTFQLNGEQHQGMTCDISAGGLYVEFRETIEPSTRLRLSFLLPTISATPVNVSAEVAWVNQGFPRTHLEYPQGFGVRFITLPPDGKAVLQQFLAQQP